MGETCTLLPTLIITVCDIFLVNSYHICPKTYGISYTSTHFYTSTLNRVVSIHERQDHFSRLKEVLEYSNSTMNFSFKTKTYFSPQTALWLTLLDLDCKKLDLHLSHWYNLNVFWIFCSLILLQESFLVLHIFIDLMLYSLQRSMWLECEKP